MSYYNLCFPHATSSLTLTGEVDPQGLPTSWYFEYGSGGSLDLQTPVQSAGAAGAVSAAVVASPPVAAYRLVAVNADGVAYGATGYLAMPTYCIVPPPPAPTGPPVVATEPPGAITYNNVCTPNLSVNVTMDAVVDGEGGQTEWFFQYGTSDA